MKRQNTVNRRGFLAVAGVTAAGAMTRPTSAGNVLTIRRQAEIPYKPDVLVVGGGPAGIGAALGAAGCTSAAKRSANNGKSPKPNIVFIPQTTPEKNNLIQEYPDKLKELRRCLEHFLSVIQPLVPVSRPPLQSATLTESTPKTS